nr:MAG TPA: hypothetical protein [Caudoviricetes sp.]
MYLYFVVPVTNPTVVQTYSTTRAPSSVLF